jgi:hypothetical protein
MTFFRLPVNVVCIVSLVMTKYVTTYQICLLCFAFMLCATVINVYIIKVYVPPDASNRRVRKTSELSEHK